MKKPSTRKHSAEGRRVFNQVAEAFVDLFQHYERQDAAAGSPEPMVTALAQLLSGSLSFVRIALAHAQAADRFKDVVEMAREREKDEWKKHRKQCARCGGH